MDLWGDHVAPRSFLTPQLYFWLALTVSTQAEWRINLLFMGRVVGSGTKCSSSVGRIIFFSTLRLGGLSNHKGWIIKFAYQGDFNYACH